jgi:hypothetical protein
VIVILIFVLVFNNGGGLSRLAFWDVVPFTLVDGYHISSIF